METNCLVLITPGNSKENIALNRVVKGRTGEAEIAKGSVYCCREILLVAFVSKTNYTKKIS